MAERSESGSLGDEPTAISKTRRYGLIAAGLGIAITVLNGALTALNAWLFLEGRKVAEVEPCNPLGLTERQALATAGHEAGHTLVAFALKPEWFVRTDLFPYGADVGDGECATGITSIETPPYLLRDELRDWLAIMYGGYAGDMAAQGQPGAGSGRDIRLATQMAARMVEEIGMGTAIPPYNFKLLGNGAGDWSARYGSQLAYGIESLLLEAERRALETIIHRRPEFDAVTRALVTPPSYSLGPNELALAVLGAETSDNGGATSESRDP